jgi:hypothetical protein
MKSSGEGTTRPAKPNPLATVSERKLTANRENAKKSTGPKTPRGKAFSRRNALKHGLLTKDLYPGFPFQGENPQEFEELFDNLMHDYQPRGVAEEQEVARIAVCRWRLKRAWRYENAEIQLGQLGVVFRGNTPRPLPAPYQTALRLLQDAEKEVEAGQEIPKELKEKVTAALPAFKEWWPHVEQMAHFFADKHCKRAEAKRLCLERPWTSLRRMEKYLDSLGHPKGFFDHAHLLATQTISGAIRMIEIDCKVASDSAFNHAYELEAIPNRDVIEKLLRYETGFERSLDRAVDRLERLQRIRRGEPVPTR